MLTRILIPIPIPIPSRSLLLMTTPSLVREMVLAWVPLEESGWAPLTSRQGCHFALLQASKHRNALLLEIIPLAEDFHLKVLISPTSSVGLFYLLHCLLSARSGHHPLLVFSQASPIETDMFLVNN